MQGGSDFSGAWEIIDLVQALTAALDAKSSYTRGHSDRVAELSWALARELGLDEVKAEAVRIAGHLHDIGKIGIPDTIISKPGPLEPSEFETMKRHTVIGSSLVEQVSHLREFAPSVRGHHERWDGRGYPDGLSGEAIPLDARIICIADSYDAMTSVRSYREQVEGGQAVAEIRRCAGRQFDPRLVGAFERLFAAGDLPLLFRMDALVGANPVSLVGSETV